MYDDDIHSLTPNQEIWGARVILGVLILLGVIIFAIHEPPQQNNTDTTFGLRMENIRQGME